MPSPETQHLPSLPFPVPDTRGFQTDEALRNLAVSHRQLVTVRQGTEKVAICFGVEIVSELHDRVDRWVVLSKSYSGVQVISSHARECLEVGAAHSVHWVQMCAVISLAQTSGAVASPPICSCW
jgi:hypothetical protein